MNFILVFGSGFLWCFQCAIPLILCYYRLLVRGFDAALISFFAILCAQITWCSIILSGNVSFSYFWFNNEPFFYFLGFILTLHTVYREASRSRLKISQTYFSSDGNEIQLKSKTRFPILNLRLPQSRALTLISKFWTESTAKTTSDFSVPFLLVLFNPAILFQTNSLVEILEISENQILPTLIFYFSGSIVGFLFTSLLVLRFSDPSISIQIWDSLKERWISSKSSDTPASQEARFLSTLSPTKRKLDPDTPISFKSESESSAPGFSNKLDKTGYMFKNVKLSTIKEYFLMSAERIRINIFSRGISPNDILFFVIGLSLSSFIIFNVRVFVSRPFDIFERQKIYIGKDFDVRIFPQKWADFLEYHGLRCITLTYRKLIYPLYFNKEGKYHGIYLYKFNMIATDEIDPEKPLKITFYRPVNRFIQELKRDVKINEEQQESIVKRYDEYFINRLLKNQQQNRIRIYTSNFNSSSDDELFWRLHWDPQYGLSIDSLNTDLEVGSYKSQIHPIYDGWDPIMEDSNITSLMFDRYDRQ